LIILIVWPIYSNHPSPSYSAWIILAELYKNDNVEDFFSIQKKSADCDHGYIYALGILANAGSEQARDLLIERLNISDEASFFCAKLAARGLLVQAYQFDDPMSLQALEEYRVEYFDYVQK